VQKSKLGTETESRPVWISHQLCSPVLPKLCVCLVMHFQH